MDDVDLAQEREHIARSCAMNQAARELEPGEAGECEWCGEQRPRLDLAPDTSPRIRAVIGWVYVIASTVFAAAQIFRRTA